MTGVDKNNNNINSNNIEARLSKLEKDVEKINKSIQSSKSKPAKGSRIKGFFSNLLILLASLFFVLSISSFWLKSNITNTDT